MFALDLAITSLILSVPINGCVSCVRRCALASHPPKRKMNDATEEEVNCGGHFNLI